MKKKPRTRTMSRDNVRGLMVYQPHAAMIVLGEKELETRDWKPAPDSGVPEGWTGTLLIVSGECSPKHGDWFLNSLRVPMVSGLVDGLAGAEKRAGKLGQGQSLLSDSCILGVVTLERVCELHEVITPCCMGKVRDSNPDLDEDMFGLIVKDKDAATMGIWGVNPVEIALGFYARGRYMWELSNPRRLPKLIPFEGRRRLFEVPEEILQQIEAQGVTL